ncbi:MAG: hypothetical protein WCK31_00305 [bacterium]
MIFESQNNSLISKVNHEIKINAVIVDAINKVADNVTDFQYSPVYKEVLTIVFAKGVLEYNLNKVKNVEDVVSTLRVARLSFPMEILAGIVSRRLGRNEVILTDAISKLDEELVSLHKEIYETSLHQNNGNRIYIEQQSLHVV